MRRFILTGAPGSGKTAILRQLEMEGFGVVQEAATDVIDLWQALGIAEPWTDPRFIDKVAALQAMREVRASQQPDPLQFHDRSVICTAALAQYLDYPLGSILRRELERAAEEALFEKTVFFIRNLGFVAPTEARRISLEESLRFECIHEEIYRQFGFELSFVEPGDLARRVVQIKSKLQALVTPKST